MTVHLVIKQSPSSASPSPAPASPTTTGNNAVGDSTAPPPRPAVDIGASPFGLGIKAWLNS